jgi:hypothetical protein
MVDVLVVWPGACGQHVDQQETFSDSTEERGKKT